MHVIWIAWQWSYYYAIITTLLRFRSYARLERNNCIKKWYVQLKKLFNSIEISAVLICVLSGRYNKSEEIFVEFKQYY